MLKSIKTNYNHTIYASYIGYITQAIVNNFAPLLFLTFATDYHLTLDKIALITILNFFVQLCVDLLSARCMDKIGYRRGILACIWALIPIVNIFYFSLVPIYSVTAGHEKISFSTLLKEKVFWLLILMMICASAATCSQHTPHRQFWL